MTVFLRSLVVYCMLLALPYQGYAAAAMMACLPSPATATATAAADAHMVMPAGPHDHAAMMAALQQAHAEHAAQSPDNASSHAGHTHGSAKCGGSACCVAGAPVLADLLSVPVLPAVSSAVAFYADYLPAVDLAHPERPPQA